MRTLITGATGFVGANLARRLLADGHAVTALVRPDYQAWRIRDLVQNGGLHVNVIDLADADAVSALIGRLQPEWAFHLAVHGAYSSQTDVQQMVKTNITSTINLLDACLDAGCAAFINTGSSSEYGAKDHAPDEREWIDPNSSYALTKAAATHYARLRALQTGARIVTLRLYSVYGAYEEPTRLLPTLIVRGLRGELPPLVNPNIARDYVYIDDVNDAYIAAAERGESGGVYNVGTGVQTTLREAVNVARRVLNIDVEPQWGTMPDRAWDTSVWVANPARITAALGWQPRYAFADGFAAFAAWLRDVGAQHEKYGVIG
ncbi:MAG: NAD-dependent epimerase/dehydratase family protein [Chloroflexota bacterium]|nr:NAD-dependent epimerase/dehydratase family protein [Chloroflexota bacterium]